MKTRAKIGNKQGNPAYRTAATFRHNKFFDIGAVKAKNSAVKNKSPFWPGCKTGNEKEPNND
ncbi:MAG: hypothetical protein WCT16_01565 [Candidatus Buchananbacteria bacterium]